MGIDGSVGIFDLKKSQMQALLLAIAIKETENFNIIFSILNISKTATTVNFSRKEKGKRKVVYSSSNGNNYTDTTLPMWR